MSASYITSHIYTIVSKSFNHGKANANNELQKRSKDKYRLVFFYKNIELQYSEKKTSNEVLFLNKKISSTIP